MAPTHELPHQLNDSEIGEYLPNIWMIVVDFVSRVFQAVRNAFDGISFERISHACLNGLDSFFNVFDGLLLSMGVGHIAASHPFLSAAALVVLSFYPAVPVIVAILMLYGFLSIFTVVILLFLGCIGFAAEGVARGSLASSYQSTNYGAFTPSGSLFSASQSYASSTRARSAPGLLGAFSPVNPFWLIVGWIYRGVAVIILCSHFFRMYYTPEDFVSVTTASMQ